MVTRRIEDARGFDEEAWARQLTTLRGWRRFVDEVPRIPDLLPLDELDELKPDARDEDDERRADYHAKLLVVETVPIQEIVKEVRCLEYLNRNAETGRCGLIVSGRATTGKTTSITQTGKTIELLHRRRSPGMKNQIPVVYVTVPPAATGRMLATEFARFLGLPVERRDNITDIIESVCGVMIDARARLVLVDEIHNIALTTRIGAEVSDTLKYFSERIPATFVYAGVSVEKAGLLTGLRGEQIAGRFSQVRTAAFPPGESWLALVTALELSLRLYKHQEGTLVGLEEYLHSRTGGMIGSLLRLVRSAGVRAVLSGSEAITKESLAAVNLNITAQQRDGVVAED